MSDKQSAAAIERLVRAGQPALRRAGRTVNRALRSGGLELRRYPAPAPAEAPLPVAASVPTTAASVPTTAASVPTTAQPDPAPAGDLLSTDQLRNEHELKAAWASEAESIIERHRQQTAETVLDLQRRYAKPLFGEVRVWDLVERLGCCIDTSDQRLYGASAYLHVLQLIDEMQTDGTDTNDMLLVAMIHDLGKLTLLAGEDPANVVCMNTAVGEHPAGVGLDNCMMQWNHDELAYQRLKDHVSEDVGWLIRYHSLEIPAVEHLMDQRDLERSERLLKPFAHYDHATKTPFRLPPVSLAAYRDIIEDAFPHPIPF